MKTIAAQLEQLAKQSAIEMYTCNAEDLDYDETLLALSEGKTEQADGTEIVIWEPFMNHAPDDVADHIDSEFCSSMRFIREVRKIIGETS